MYQKVNEKGQALVIVLFCSVVALLFVVAVLFMVSRGQQTSGMEKRYETSLDAADAGVSVSVKLIDEKVLNIAATATGAFADIPAATSPPYNIDSLNPVPGDCLYDKLNLPTASWGASCGAPEKSLNPEESPDITFTIRGTNNSALYDVNAKIVDSRKGVTGTPPGNLQSGGVVNSDGVLTPVNLPYFYYTVEVSAKMRNQSEQAHLTYIYAD